MVLLSFFLCFAALGVTAAAICTIVRRKRNTNCVYASDALGICIVMVSLLCAVGCALCFWRKPGHLAALWISLAYFAVCFPLAVYFFAWKLDYAEHQIRIRTALGKRKSCRMEDITLVGKGKRYLCLYASNGEKIKIRSNSVGAAKFMHTLKTYYNRVMKPRKLEEIPDMLFSPITDFGSTIGALFLIDILVISVMVFLFVWDVIDLRGAEDPVMCVTVEDYTLSLDEGSLCIEEDGTAHVFYFFLPKDGLPDATIERLTDEPLNIYVREKDWSKVKNGEVRNLSICQICDADGNEIVTPKVIQQGERRNLSISICVEIVILGFFLGFTLLVIYGANHATEHPKLLQHLFREEYLNRAQIDISQFNND